jgi:transcriptional regulator with XRE-family HTH domain
MSLQEWVKQLRKEHGWSQGELAERVGGDPAQISRYENGRIPPSADAVGQAGRGIRRVDRLPAGRGQPRRPFRGAEDALGDRLGTIGELSAEDLTLLLGFLDALVTKNRLKALAGGVS